MAILIYIIPLIALMATIYKVYKSQRKYLLKLNLISVYDKIELYIIKTRPHLNNDDIRFLKSNKNIAINPQFLELEFILAIDHLIKKKKIKVDTTWYKNYLSNEGPELDALIDEYINIQLQLTKISALKVKYIVRAIWFQLKNFINNRTLNINAIVINKIEKTLYTGNNLANIAA